MKNPKCTDSETRGNSQGLVEGVRSVALEGYLLSVDFRGTPATPWTCICPVPPPGDSGAHRWPGPGGSEHILARGVPIGAASEALTVPFMRQSHSCRRHHGPQSEGTPRSHGRGRSGPHRPRGLGAVAVTRARSHSY